MKKSYNIVILKHKSFKSDSDCLHNLLHNYLNKQDILTIIFVIVHLFNNYEKIIVDSF